MRLLLGGEGCASGGLKRPVVEGLCVAIKCSRSWAGKSGVNRGRPVLAWPGGNKGGVGCSSQQCVVVDGSAPCGKRFEFPPLFSQTQLSWLLAVRLRPGPSASTNENKE